MPYDPDADPEDLDPVEAVDAYLNDPGTVARLDQMGAASRDLPPAQQLAELSALLPAAVQRRDELAARLAAEGAPDDDARRVLLAECVSWVDRLAARIAELTGPAPDHL